MSDKTQDQAAPEPEEQEEAETIADQFRALLDLGEGAAEGHAQLFRKVRGDDDQYLEQFRASQLRANPLEVVKDRHGGGSYRLMLRDSAGKYIKGGSFHFDIAGPPKSAREEEKQSRADEEERLAELERRLAERAADAPTGELVKIMWDEIREMRREMRHPPAAASQANPLEMAVSLASTIQAAQQPLLQELLSRRNDPSDQLEMMKSLLDIARSLGPGADDGMGTIARTLAPSLAGLLNQHVDLQRTTGAAPAMTHPNPPASAGSPAHLPAWAQHLQPHMETLLGWASRGNNPQLHGAFVLEHLPEEALEPIYRQLTRPNYMAEFLDVFPAAGPFRGWFEQFFTEIRDGIQEEPEPGPAAPQEPRVEVGRGEPPPEDGEE